MPVYRHDCTSCRFITHADAMDWYLAGGTPDGCNGGSPTIVARWSNDGPDYHTWPLILLPMMVKAWHASLEALS